MAGSFDIGTISGLTNVEVADRHRTEGFNELPQSKKKSVFSILLEIVREPMFLLLIACGILYMLLGDFEEALMLLGFVFVIIGITLYQENKTERALDALRDLSSPRVSRPFVTAHRPVSRDERWYARISSCSPRATVFQPMLSSSIPSIFPPTNHC